MICLWSGFSLNKVPREARTFQLHGQSSGCQMKPDHRDPSQSLVLLIFRTSVAQSTEILAMNKICRETRRVKERAIRLRIYVETEYEGCQTWSTLARPVFACGLYLKRERALSAGITSDSFRVSGANLAASPRFREKRVTWSVTESTSLFNYRAQWGLWMTNTDWKRWHFSASTVSANLLKCHSFRADCEDTSRFVPKKMCIFYKSYMSLFPLISKIDVINILFENEQTSKQKRSYATDHTSRRTRRAWGLRW